MNIKRGVVVSHTGAIEWGVGKVMEVASAKATIQFSDGITRKIAATHYAFLQPGDPAFFVPVAETTKVAKVRAPRIPKIPKIPKQPKAPKAAKTKKPAEEQILSTEP